MKTFEQQAAETIKTLAVWCSILSAGLLITLGVAIWGQIRVSQDAASTCLIQARGLPAGHELAASMGEIHLLLTLPPSPDAPPTPAPVRQIVADLNGHLARYLAAEASQPAQRNC